MPNHLVHRDGVIRYLHEGNANNDGVSPMWYVDMCPIEEEGSAKTAFRTPLAWEPVLARV